jgi:hypothetical protein
MLWHGVVTMIYRRQLPVDFQSSGTPHPRGGYDLIYPNQHVGMVEHVSSNIDADQP